jgi:nicotinate phosphoribosyltransferase
MIINSILDTDLYKLTMQAFVLAKYPETTVTYTFNNRNKDMKFNKNFLNALHCEIGDFSCLKLKNDEFDYLRAMCPYLPITYLEYLKNFRFNPNDIELDLDDQNQLQLTIKGKWRDTILWEVPLMATISQLYFQAVDTDWNTDQKVQENNANQKAIKLSKNNCLFADFGTRRRRSLRSQIIVVDVMKEYAKFVGTSNVHLAYKFNVKPLGTTAHEMIQATAALESMNHPNRFFMENWAEVYKGSLGTMLPDTYGINSFLKDFTMEKAKLWDSVRHDSGDPYTFTDKIVNHYKQLNIDPLTKTIIFSDGLDVNTAIEINEYCKGKIKCSFGIGTNFTNNFVKINGEKSKPLNMVIKLQTVNGIPVVKLSDTPTKAIGDPTMIKIMKNIHFGEPL